MKLQTVNVIELFSGIFESVHSFTDDKEGNSEAEQFFFKRFVLFIKLAHRQSS